MTTAERTSIASPANSLLVFDTDAEGFWYYFNGWTNLLSNMNGAWITIGNVCNSNGFIGTTNDQPVAFNVNTQFAGQVSFDAGNSFYGIGAGQCNTFGFSNIAIGDFALHSNTDRPNLLAVGDSKLFNNAEGVQSLYSNITEYGNTANGHLAAYSNKDP